MKRILSLILVLLLALTVFVGCDKIKLPDIFGKPEEEPTPTYDIDAAVEYVKQLYIEDAVSTGADYELVGQVMVAGAKYTVTWTVDTDAISVTVDGLKVTIDVPDESAEEISYKLTATVAAPDGKTGTYTFDRLVPKFKVNTYAEYIAAKDGDALVVEGIIYGIMSKEAGDKENSIFVQDLSGNGGYYLYAVSDDVIAQAVIGQTIEARGNKAIYNGTPELKNAAIKVLDTTIKTVAPADLTAAYTAAADAKDAALLAHLGGLVTVKGVTVLDAGDNGYYYFELDGVKTYLRISSSSNCSSADDEKTITKNHAAKFYYSADVTGIAAIYNGAFYIMPVDANAFSNFSDEMQPMPDDVKVSFESGKLTLPTEIVSANTITLPSVGATVKEVTITWALAEGTTNATIVDGVLAGVLPESGSVDVVITATLTAGDETATKEFTISVKKLDTTTITDANGIATEAGDSYTTDKYIVAGTIVEVVNDKYGNIYIADAEGNRFYVYGVYSAYGDLRYDKFAEAPKVGDTVVLYGVLGTYTKDGVATIQMKNAWLLSWEHVYTLGDTVDPTCTEDGYTNATCACGHEAKLNVVPATGHQNPDVREAIEPTCQQEGYTAGTYCLDCETYIEGGEYLGKAADHNWVENVCTWCKVPNHTCEYTANPVVTAPKCEEGGYTTYTCYFEGCGKTEVRDETNPTGHVNTTEVVTKQPSCYEATDEEPNAGLGEKQVVCSCGHVVSTTPLDRVAHTPDREAATCTAAKVCTVCEKELEAKLSHTYENGACACGAKDPSYLAEMTVEEALKAPEGQKVKLTGTVTGFYEVWSSYGNCSPYITDETGKTILVFRTTTEVKLGDIIEVTGTITAYKEVNQIAQSGSVVTVTGHDTSYDVVEEYTIPEANAAADGTNVCVTGIVVRIDYAWSGSTMSLYIADENGNELYIYKLATEVKHKDIIKVTGAMATYNGNRQITGATAEVTGTHTCSKWTEASCLAPKTCVLCGATEGTTLDHNFGADGKCTTEGCLEVQGVTNTTVSTTVDEYGNANGWTMSAGNTSGGQWTTMKLGDVTITVDASDANSGKWYSGNWRMYQKGSPAITFTAAEGKTIVSIKITYTISNTGILTQGSTQIKSGTVVEVNANTITFGVGNSGTADNGQVRITAIEVVYH